MTYFLSNDDDSQFVVFKDKHQDIFNRSTGFNQVFKDFPRKLLKKNCRNTKTIVNYLGEILKVDMVPYENSPQGKQIITRNCQSNGEEIETLKNDITELIDEGVRPEDIVILIPDGKYTESSIYSLKSIKQYSLKWMGNGFRPERDTLQVTMIGKFKGLESQVIMITDHKEEVSPEELYTKSSRANSLLYIYNKQS